MFKVFTGLVRETVQKFLTLYLFRGPEGVEIQTVTYVLGIRCYHVSGMDR